jgi:hypothetical protein
MSGFVNLAVSYAFFALITTVSNIGVQDLVIRVYNGTFNVLLSVVVGTGVGLVVKYAIDNRYILRFAHGISPRYIYFCPLYCHGLGNNCSLLGFRVLFSFFLCI